MIDRVTHTKKLFTKKIKNFEIKKIILHWNTYCPINSYMASWQNSSGRENHKSVFENISHDRCIFCGGDRTEIARTDFTIYFSEFEYSTGSICKTCYHANAKQVKAV